jgi:hypothetical protein
MAGKSDTWENALLLLLFNNTNVANVGDATGLRGSTVAGSLYFSLHTADPTDTGTQVSSEATYTSYTRVAAARSSSAFTVTTNAVALVADVVFPAGTGGSGTVTHWGVGLIGPTGAGNLLYSGTLTPNIVTGNGVTPRITLGTIITED